MRENDVLDLLGACKAMKEADDEFVYDLLWMRMIKLKM